MSPRKDFNTLAQVLVKRIVSAVESGNLNEANRLFALSRESSIYESLLSSGSNILTACAKRPLAAWRRVDQGPNLLEIALLNKNEATIEFLLQMDGIETAKTIIKRCQIEKKYPAIWNKFIVLVEKYKKEKEKADEFVLLQAMDFLNANIYHVEL